MNASKLIVAMSAILFPISMLGASQVKTWHLKTDAQKSVPMEDVARLVQSPDSETFSVELKNGDILQNIAKVTFEQKGGSGGVDKIGDGLSVYPTMVESDLHVKGCAIGSTIRILSLQGIVLRELVFMGDMVVDVVGFSPGMYLLQVESSQIRFIKL